MVVFRISPARLIFRRGPRSGNRDPQRRRIESHRNRYVPDEELPELSSTRDIVDPQAMIIPTCDEQGSRGIESGIQSDLVAVTDRTMPL